MGKVLAITKFPSTSTNVRVAFSAEATRGSTGGPTPEVSLCGGPGRGSTGQRNAGGGSRHQTAGHAGPGLNNTVKSDLTRLSLKLPPTTEREGHELTNGGKRWDDQWS